MQFKDRSMRAFRICREDRYGWVPVISRNWCIHSPSPFDGLQTCPHAAKTQHLPRPSSGWSFRRLLRPPFRSLHSLPKTMPISISIPLPKPKSISTGKLKKVMWFSSGGVVGVYVSKDREDGMTAFTIVQNLKRVTMQNQRVHLTSLNWLIWKEQIESTLPHHINGRTFKWQQIESTCATHGGFGVNPNKHGMCESLLRTQLITIFK